MAQISIIYSRAWIVLFYATTICALLALRFLFVKAIVLGSQAGLISAQRIFLIGAGREIDQFITRYQPWKLGVNVVGCHFFAPVHPAATAPERRQAMERACRSIPQYNGCWVV